MIGRFAHRRRTPDLSMDELHRRYRLVMEQAQLFEQVIRGHAQRLEFVSLREMGSAPTVLPQMQRIDGKTIGWVEHRYELPQDAKELVNLARELRNDLAHNFFESIDKHSAAGRLRAAGIARRSRLMDKFAALLMSRVPTHERPSEIIAEAIVGAVWQVAHRYIARGAAQQLPELTDHATYLVLAPIIGGDAAMERIAARNLDAGRT